MPYPKYRRLKIENPALRQKLTQHLLMLRGLINESRAKGEYPSYFYAHRNGLKEGFELADAVLKLEVAKAKPSRRRKLLAQEKV